MTENNIDKATGTAGTPPTQGASEEGKKDNPIPASEKPDGGIERKRSEKRPEPQTVPEFISAFYTGKVKSLSDGTLRRIKTTGLYFDAATRGELRRSALELDDTLDKSRRLMVLASEVPDLKALGSLLMEFSSEVVVFHPRLRRNGLQARLFPTYHDDNDLAAAWEFLLESKEAAGDEQQAQPVGSTAADEPAPVMEAGEPGKKKAVSEQTLASKVRRNALLCSVVWRVSRGAAFQDVMRGLRSSLFKLPAWPAALERELLEAVALMQDKEDGKVALLLEWQTRQQTELAARLEQSTRTTLLLQSDIQDLKRTHEELASTNDALTKAVEALHQNKEQLNARLGVVQTHGQADFEELRSMALRLVAESSRKLEEVAAALSREQPKVTFAREVLNGVVDALTSGKKKLEDV